MVVTRCAGRPRDELSSTTTRRGIRLVASSDTAIRHGRGWVEREPLVQRSRPGQQRARERLRIRGDQPRMSAAWNQCGSPLTAFNSTSWTVIARSRAVSGYASTHLVEVIGASGQELTYIIRAAYRPTETSFITPPELKQQVGYDVYPAVRRSHGTPTG